MLGRAPISAAIPAMKLQPNSEGLHSRPKLDEGRIFGLPLSAQSSAFEISLFHFGRQHLKVTFVPQEREGSPENPILLNPFRRGVPPTIKNKDDFPDLEG